MTIVPLPSEGQGTPKFRVYDFLQDGDLLICEAFCSIRDTEIQLHEPIIDVPDKRKPEWEKKEQGPRVFLLRNSRPKYRVFQDMDPQSKFYLQYYITVYRNKYEEEE